MSRPDERFSVWYREGNFVDIKNAESVWTVGLVKATDPVRGFNIFYEDNKKPVQMWLGKASERIAPFRQHSSLKELTLAVRNSGATTADSLRSVEAAIARGGREPMAVVQWMRGEVFFRVLELLETNPTDQVEVMAYLDTVGRVVQLCGEWIKANMAAREQLFLGNLSAKDAYLRDYQHAIASCWPEVFELLRVLLTCERPPLQSISRSRQSDQTIASKAVETFVPNYLPILLGELAEFRVPFHMIGSLPIWSVLPKIREAEIHCVSALESTALKAQSLSPEELRFFDPSALKQLLETVSPLLVHLSPSHLELPAKTDQMVLNIAAELMKNRERMEARIQGLRVYALAVARSGEGAVDYPGICRDEVTGFLKQYALPAILAESNVEAINLSVPILERIAEDGQLAAEDISALLRQQGHDSTVAAKSQLLVKIAPKCSDSMLTQIVNTWTQHELKPVTVATMKDFTINANSGRQQSHQCFLRFFIEKLQHPTPQSQKVSVDMLKAIVDSLKALRTHTDLQTHSLDKLAEGISRRDIESLKCFHHVLFNMHQQDASQYLSSKQAAIVDTIVQWAGATPLDRSDPTWRNTMLNFQLSLINCIATLGDPQVCLQPTFLTQIRDTFTKPDTTEAEVELLFLWMRQMMMNERLCANNVYLFTVELFRNPHISFLEKAGTEVFYFCKERFLHTNALLLVRDAFSVTFIYDFAQLVGVETLYNLTFIPASEAIRNQAAQFVSQLLFRCQAGPADFDPLGPYLSLCFQRLQEGSSIVTSKVLSALLQLVDAYLEITTINPSSRENATFRVRHQDAQSGVIQEFLIPSNCCLGDVRKAIGGSYHNTWLQCGQNSYTFAFDYVKLANFGIGIDVTMYVKETYQFVDPLGSLAGDSVKFSKLQEVFLTSRDLGMQKVAWKLLAKLALTHADDFVQQLGGRERVSARLRESVREQLQTMVLMDSVQMPFPDLASSLHACILKPLADLSQQYESEFEQLSTELVFQYCVKLAKLLISDTQLSQDQAENDRCLQGMCIVYRTFARTVIKEPALIDTESFLWLEVVQSWVSTYHLSAGSILTQFLSDKMFQIVFCQQTCEALKVRFGGLLVSLKEPPFRLGRDFDRVLLSFLEVCLSSSAGSNNEAYFDAFNRILADHEIETSSAIPQILKYVSSRNKENVSDATLAGCFSILVQAVQKDMIGSTESLNRLVKDLLELYLFPSKRNKYPLCRSSTTREKAFKVLEIVCKKNDRDLMQVIQHVSEFHSNLTWRKSSLKSWLVPAQEEKSLPPFTGLRNLGATCYMNSVLQQLYMTPQFREAIFKERQLPRNAGVFSEVTKILLKLRYSEKPYVSTKRLCEAYKNWDGEPINPRDQMDVEEFLGGLFDKMKEDSQEPRVTELVDSVFSGTTVNIITGESGCSHESRRQETHYVIPIEVANKSSVKESLDSLVKKEMMEGESAYNCESCGRKVTAGKRQLFKHLPEVLILSLRRFAYSVELGRRKKINDYFEFEEVIDMEPYMEKEKEQEEEDLLRSMTTIRETTPKTSHQYRLTGIVIHMGEAEAGHYISLVVDSTKKHWIEFNDTQVSLIDEKKMREMAFGSRSDLPQQVAQTSAYLLLYEKVSEMRLETFSSIRQVPVPEASDINSKNESFLYKKCVLKPEYTHFVKCLLDIQESRHTAEIVKFAVSYYCTIHARAQASDSGLMATLYKQFRKTREIHLWFAEIITSDHGAKEFLLECPQLVVRKFIVSLFKAALETLSQQRRPLAQRLASMLPLIKHPATDRQCVYFEALYQLSKPEISPVIETNLPSMLIAKIVDRPVHTAFPRAPSDQWGYGNLPPVTALEVPQTEAKTHYAFHLAIIQRCESRLSQGDKELIASEGFIKEAVAGAYNKLGGQKTAALYAKKSEQLRPYLSHLQLFFQKSDYERYGVAFVQVKKTLEANNYSTAIVDTVMQMLLQVLEQNRGYVMATAWLLKGIYKLMGRKSVVMTWAKSNKEIFRFEEAWNREYQRFSTGQSSLAITKVPQFFPPSIYQVIPDILTMLSNFAPGRIPNNEGENDSDADSYDVNYNDQAELMVGGLPVEVRFDENFGLMFQARYNSVGGEKAEFIAADDDRLMPQYTKIATPQ